MVVFPPSRRDGGFADRTWSTSGPTYRRLLDAATRLDVESVAAILRASIAHHGVVATWQRLVHPVALDLGDGPGDSIAAVLFRRAVYEELSAIDRSSGGRSPSVLLACADEEHESLPLDAVAAALAESGVACVALGARVPPRASVAAARRLRPAVVVVWSHAPDTADRGQLLPLLRPASAPAVLAAGPGWDTSSLPSPVVPVLDVGAVVAVTLARLRWSLAGPAGRLVRR